MLLIRKLFLTLSVWFNVLIVFANVNAPNIHKSFFKTAQNVRDTPPPQPQTLRYPINDSRNDGVSATNRGTFYLPNPSNVKDSVVYNAITRTYSVYEKIGDKYYRTPTTYSFDEYWAIQNRKSEIA